MQNELTIKNYLHASQRLQATTTGYLVNANNCLGTPSQHYYECHAVGPNRHLPSPPQPSMRFIIITIIHI